MEPQTTSITSLKWHQQRRAQTIPTLSVLIGPVPLCVDAWRKANPTRPALLGFTRDALLRDATSAIISSVDLLAVAQSWLRTHAHWGTAEPPDLTRMTQYDLDSYWQTIPDTKRIAGAAVVYSVLLHAAQGTSWNAASLVDSLGAIAVLEHLCALVPEPDWPAILLINDDATETSIQALTKWEELAVRIPYLSVGIAVSAEAYAKCSSIQSRTMALAREGEIRLEGVSADRLVDDLHAAGVPEPLPKKTIQMLADVGLPPDVAEAFIATAKAGVETQLDPTEANETKHKSSAEKFLFDLLQMMPETAGHFGANVQLPFLHGHKKAEADIVSLAWKLVIEVDGAYFHLNKVQYRRDRRKDNSYQQHGYWVLRFLAEDVVVALETILNTILNAVKLRRSEVP